MDTWLVIYSYCTDNIYIYAIASQFKFKIQKENT